MTNIDPLALILITLIITIDTLIMCPNALRRIGHTLHKLFKSE